MRLPAHSAYPIMPAAKFGGTRTDKQKSVKKFPTIEQVIKGLDAVPYFEREFLTLDNNALRLLGEYMSKVGKKPRKIARDFADYLQAQVQRLENRRGLTPEKAIARLLGNPSGDIDETVVEKYIQRRS